MLGSGTATSGSGEQTPDWCLPVRGFTQSRTFLFREAEENLPFPCSAATASEPSSPPAMWKGSEKGGENPSSSREEAPHPHQAGVWAGTQSRQLFPTPTCCGGSKPQLGPGAQRKGRGKNPHIAKQTRACRTPGQARPPPPDGGSHRMDWHVDGSSSTPCSGDQQGVGGMCLADKLGKASTWLGSAIASRLEGLL